MDLEQIKAEHAGQIAPANLHPAVRTAMLAHGRNRSDGMSQLAADNDIQAVSAWIAQYRSSPNTRSSYEREARRLILWAAKTVDKPLSDLVFEDLDSYRQFLADPAPSEEWIGTRKLPLSHVAWRPFQGPLSPESVQQSMVILRNMFTWLVQAGHLASNPFVLLKGRLQGQQASRKPPSQRLDVHRTIPEGLWTTVMSKVSGMQPGAERNRLRWALTVFWFGLRVTEACTTTMGQVVREPTPAGTQDRYWLSVIGKGQKERWIPLTAEFMTELATYRCSLGLSPIPMPGDPRPLIGRLRSQSRHEPLQRGALHKMVKRLLDAVASDIQDSAPENAALLRLVSSHWIRHTSATRMVNTTGMRLTTARDVLGHSNITTTNTYLNEDRDKLHAEVAEKLKVGWSDLPGDQGKAQPSQEHLQ